MESGGIVSSGRWVKQGVVVSPNPGVSWMSTHVGPSFATSNDETVTLFVTGRDDFNQSRIGVVDGTLSNVGFENGHICQKPLLDLGEIGTFDESGVSYPWLVTHGDDTYMYYVGWTAGTRTRFRNFLGLAISRDGGESFHRFSRVPILDRTDSEPFGTGSCAVWIDDEGWHMVYTAFDPWWFGDSRQEPRYRLKEALSDDGTSWHRTGRVVVDYATADEHVISRPMIMFDHDLTRLWYCYRGSSYRIGYAESLDGYEFRRRDCSVGINVSESGWDSEMIEYAFVLDHDGERYMFYNGNQFGKTGLGLAVHQSS